MRRKLILWGVALVAIAAAACVAMEYTDGYLQLLKWDKIGAKYLPFRIDLRGEVNGDGVSGV